MGMVAVRKTGSSDPILKVVFGVPSSWSDGYGAVYFDLPAVLKNKTVVAGSVAYTINGGGTGTVWYDPAQKKWYLKQHLGAVSECGYDPANARVRIAGNANTVAATNSYSVTYEE